MNKFFTKFIIVLMLTTSAKSIAADPSNIYVGVKIGLSKIISSDELYVETDHNEGYGIYGGYIFENGYSVEFEHIKIDTELGSHSHTTTGTSHHSHDIAIGAYAIYGTYKTSGITYLKGRLGYVKLDAIQANNTIMDKNGMAFGLGAGLKIGSTNVEIDYNYLDSDIRFVSLSVDYQF